MANRSQDHSLLGPRCQVGMFKQSRTLSSMRDELEFPGKAIVIARLQLLHFLFECFSFSVGRSGDQGLYRSDDTSDPTSSERHHQEQTEEDCRQLGYRVAVSDAKAVSARFQSAGDHRTLDSIRPSVVLLPAHCTQDDNVLDDFWEAKYRERRRTFCLVRKTEELTIVFAFPVIVLPPRLWSVLVLVI